MSGGTAEVVVCGAGIAGVADAYHLAVRRGVRGVVLVDERPPLSLTSDKSAECYRNWWPGPGSTGRIKAPLTERPSQYPPLPFLPSYPPPAQQDLVFRTRRGRNIFLRQKSAKGATRLEKRL